MARRTKGSGSLKKRGRIWWIFYTAADGRQVPESSGSESKEVARTLLEQRTGALALGEDVTPRKTTISDLCALVMADYEVRDRCDTKIVKWRFAKHVEPAIGRLRAAKFGPQQARAYIKNRQDDGAENATINRELSIVRRGYKLGSQEEPPLVTKVPYIPKLEEDNARQGFLEPEQYEELLEKLPSRLKALFVCAYHVGTRKGEVRKIRIDQVDFDAGLIRIERRQTKGKKPRTLPIYGDMERWLRAQIDTAREGCPYVFHNGKGRLVGSHLVGWREACEAAGLPDLIFHDLRRSAIRNMKRAGVSDKVAMTISGHLTRSIFDRYDIVDEDDLEDAGKKLESYAAERKRQRAAKLQRVK